RLHALGELQVLAVPRERLVLPHADHDLDGFAPVLAAAVVGGHAERGLLHGGGTAGAPLDATLAEDVDRGHLLGDAGGMDEPERHERHTETELDLLGAERETTEDRLGARRGRPTVAEVVLDDPDG